MARIMAAGFKTPAASLGAVLPAGGLVGFVCHGFVPLGVVVNPPAPESGFVPPPIGVVEVP